MTKQLFIGLTTEGTTDMRFLESVVTRTFEDVVMNECMHDVDISVHEIKTNKIGLSFAEYVLNAAKEGVEKYGIMILTVHTDADKDTYQQRLENKIKPALHKINEIDDENCCKILTPIIPVRMIEAWMLADKELLKRQIGTSLSDNELLINKNPETIANPKQVIEEAIRIATANLPKRRQKLSISDLYAIIGDTIALTKLEQLDSYCKFQEEVRGSLKNLNYIH